MATTLPILSEQCCGGLPAPVTDERIADAAARFKALADPTRLQLLHLIAHAETGEACVCDLTAAVNLSQPTVSHHLGKLVDAGLIDRERRGTWPWYRAQPSGHAALASL